MTEHFPDLIPVHALGERFGISGVTVEAGGEAAAWGDVEGHDAD